MTDVISQFDLGKANTQQSMAFVVFGRLVSAIDVVLLVLIGCALLTQLQLQFVQKINWDEFFYLSHIYEAQAGSLTKTLQMGHVYLFGWLTKLPGGEIAQITAGRIVMWLAQIGTLILIVKTALRFMPLTYALFSALCFLGLGFVFVHGTSFRADPLAAFCMMYSVYIFAVSDLKRRNLILLSFTLALGAFITVKVVLFITLLAVLALWRLKVSNDRQALIIGYCGTLLLSAILFISALLLHKSTLSAQDYVSTTSSLSSTAKTVFLSGGLFPRSAVIEAGIYTGFLPSLFVIFGVIIAAYHLAFGKTKIEKDIIILAFALPLLTFVFYRNAYPYFYGFIFPPCVILAGYAAQKLKLSNLAIGSLAVMTSLSNAFVYQGRLDDTRAVQVETLSALHQIFPDPVHYFDRNSMAASFPKAGIFMSSWGLKNYQNAEVPRFLPVMEAKAIPLLIDNSPAISAALRRKPTVLMDVDAAALRDNYIPHWGYIWVAGKQLNISRDETKFKILTPGVYTIESDNNLKINGQSYKAGETVELGRATHIITSNTPQSIKLRWGDNLLRPVEVANPNPIYGHF